MREKIKDFLSSLLFTPNGTCPVCGKVILSKDRFFCSSCQQELPLSLLMRCESCGRPAANRQKCQNCIKAEEKATDGGCVWLEYTGAAQKMIREMKFNYRQELCVYAGKQLAQVVQAQSWVSSIDVLTPVPLHVERLKERGYNQSMLIAKGVSAGLKNISGHSIPVMPLLRRVIDTPHQVGKNRKERLSNLNAAFVSADGAEIEGKCILVIDDVLTTGTTTRACSEVLRLAGARKVYTAVCAAVPDLSRA